MFPIIYQDIAKKAQTWRLTLVRDLLQFASLNGDVTDDERTCLIESASNIGITAEELRFVLDYPESVPDDYPREIKHRVTYVQEMVTMRSVLESITPMQVAFLQEVFEKLGFVGILEELDKRLKPDDQA